MFKKLANWLKDIFSPKDFCAYKWIVLSPARLATSHGCKKSQGHQGEHQCWCGKTILIERDELRVGDPVCVKDEDELGSFTGIGVLNRIEGDTCYVGYSDGQIFQGPRNRVKRVYYGA